MQVTHASRKSKKIKPKTEAGSFPIHNGEGIATNILADRLRKLEQAGLIAKSAYQEHPVRYAYGLTEKGKALSDVLLALVRWGKKHIPGTLVLERPAQHSVRGRKPSGKQDRNS